MLQGMRPVVLSHKSLDDYIPIAGEDQITEIRTLVEPLKGARVLHVSSTAFGGGVAEMLHTLVPLMVDAGLNAEWRILAGADEFFAVTKLMHNALQGMELKLTPDMRATYLRTNIVNSTMLEEEYDFVVVHDPQPAPLRSLRRADRGKWIWRCHIDLTDADPDVWAFLKQYVEEYDAAIFTMPQYVKRGLKVRKLAFITPAIDPLSPKNLLLSQRHANDVLRLYNIDPRRPQMLQVSRFDPWKDPLGVIDAYRMVKKRVPELQLVMVGSMATDDPEGMEYYQRTRDHAGADPDIHLLSNLDGVGNVEVNAFQRTADVIVQKSLREGFGLTVSEGLWKGKPVVGGKCGGIPLQIQDGETGFLVESIEECADRVLYLLQNPERAREMGLRGREYVRQHFICTVNLRSYLRLFQELMAGAMPRAEQKVAAS
jgi:trehalose synthase